MENTNHTKFTRIVLLGLAFILLSASIIGYVVSRHIQTNQIAANTLQPSPVPTIAPTLIPYPTNGSFVLREQSGHTTVPLGGLVTFDVIATSGTDTVAGYDAILSYDETAFSLQSVQNKLDTFRIFTYDRTTHLVISATKNLQVSTPIRFDNTPILSITLSAKKKGMYVFSLKPVANESSKLVDETVQVTYPQSQDFRLEIN